MLVARFDGKNTPNSIWSEDRGVASAPNGTETGLRISAEQLHRIAMTYGSASAIVRGVQQPTSPRDLSDPRGAANTETEQRMARLWTDVLRVRDVGVDDDFFECGGNSVTAVQLLSRIRNEFGVELSLMALFESSPTISHLSRTIESSGVLGS
jgi:acyl carrier protein